MTSRTSRSDSLPGPWRHRLIHVRGQRLHVAERGRSTDPLVLFLHGSTGGWFEWRKVLPLLNDGSDVSHTVHAVALSMRGYGQSDRTPNGYDPLEAAQDVASSIRSLGHSTALLVCQGLGTWVAWTLAATQPKLVAGIIGCGSAHPRAWLGQLKTPWSEESRGTLAPLLRKSLWNSRPHVSGVRRGPLGSQTMPARTTRIIDNLVNDALAATGDGFAASPTGIETADLMRDSLTAGALRPALAHISWWTRPSPTTFRKWISAMEKSSLSDDRTLLLVGEEDTRTPPALAQMSSENVVVIPGCGHFLPVEAPETVARAVAERLDWLPRNS